MFKFDNSYSWTRSKEVFYSIQVLPPNTNPDLPDVSGGDRDQECANGAVACSVSVTTGDTSADEFHDSHGEHDNSSSSVT